MSVILLNGFPKSGTHALLKAVELLGMPVRDGRMDTQIDHAELHHVPYSPFLDRYNALMEIQPAKHILIKRDPRNTLISWMRFSGKVITEETFQANYLLYEQKSFSDSLDMFIGWLTEPYVHVVKFEDLTGDGGATLQGIADYLGVKCPANAYAKIPGHTITWTGKLSDYNSLWTPDLETWWQTNGGTELLAKWGY